MSADTQITRIRATEVLVPARPGAVSSPGMNRPLHQLPWQGSGSWSVQFDAMPKVVLELELGSGVVGLGELYRAHEWTNVDALADALVGRDVRTFSLQSLPIARVHEYDGFEMAVWDAYARSAGLRVVDLLGGPVRDKVLVNAWSSHRTADEMRDLAAGFQRDGFTMLKLKCSLDDDVVGWSVAIADAAPGLDVLLDPNGRFERFAEARRLGAALAEIGNVRCLEDPLPHWMLDDWARLRNTVSIALARHISLAYPQHAHGGSEAIAAIRSGAADMLNITAGLVDFQRMAHVAELASMPCWHGSQVDFGIAEAAYLHACAAAPACTWPSDVFGRRIREHDLLREPLTIDPPYASVPTGLGLGVDLDDDARTTYRVFEKEYTSRD